MHVFRQLPHLCEACDDGFCVTVVHRGLVSKHEVQLVYAELGLEVIAHGDAIRDVGLHQRGGAAIGAVSAIAAFM